MTQPTIDELQEMDEATPRTRAAIEVCWAFTEWWEGLDELEDPDLASGKFNELLAAYTRWRNLR